MNPTDSERAAEIAAVRAMLGALIQRGDTRPDIAETRANYDAWGLSYPLPDRIGVSEETLGGRPCEALRPDGAERPGALLYLHGGGYVLGSPRSHRHLASRLAEAAAVDAWVLDYRLAPEHPFPAAVEDAANAYGALLERGIPAGRIIIAGDSAGGGLSVAAALEIRARGLPQPAGLFAISPWANLAQTGDSYARMAGADLICTRPDLQAWADLYLAGRDPAEPLASPIVGDLTGLAPLLIHVGSDEVLLSDAARLAEAAGLARVPCTLAIAPDMPHVWHYMWPQLTDARRAIDEAATWMRAQLS